MTDNTTKIMLFLDNSLVKKEYSMLFIFLIFAIILTVLIIGASYLLVRQNPESKKWLAYECSLSLMRIQDTLMIYDFV